MASIERLSPEARGTRSAKQTTCTYHCGSCGLHFHSLNGFDAHRAGAYGSNDPEIGRRCIHPDDLEGKLAALTDEGLCRMYDDGSGTRLNAGVTIWTHAGDLSRMRALVASSASYGAERHAHRTLD